MAVHLGNNNVTVKRNPHSGRPSVLGMVTPAELQLERLRAELEQLADY